MVSSSGRNAPGRRPASIPGSAPMRRRDFMTLIGGAVLGGAGIGGLPLAARQPAPRGPFRVLRKNGEGKAVVRVVAMATDRKGPFYQGAFGAADAATGRALTTDALFRIASM